MSPRNSETFESIPEHTIRDKSQLKTATFTVRFTPGQTEFLRRWATDDQRTVANIVRICVERAMTDPRSSAYNN